LRNRDWGRWGLGAGDWGYSASRYLSEVAMNIKSYMDLEVWQLGMEIVEITYRLTRNFPPEEIYGLRLQMRKASISIPSNLAEGHEREGTKKFLHFLSIARGSLGELNTQYLVSVRLSYIKEEDFQLASNKLNVLGKKLANLYKSLRAKTN
jgi:four helix bundle protein